MMGSTTEGHGARGSPSQTNGGVRESNGPEPNIEELGVRLRGGVKRVIAWAPLREYTTLRVGGPARWLCEVDTVDQLAHAVRLCRRLGIPYRCLGGGSNVLASDDGYSGLVILQRIRTTSFHGPSARIGGGLPLGRLVKEMVNRGAESYAGLAGIPGTVGGAVVGNAGAYGVEIGDLTLEATVVTAAGQIETRSRQRLSFRYRHSALKDGEEILAEVRLRLDPGDPETGRREMARIIADRHAKHPYGTLPTAGCFFKNIQPKDASRRISAGYYLDRAGAKGLSLGGASVYPKHANIVITDGQAHARDVLELAAEMRRRVWEEFGIRLEREVQWLGDEEID